jgi:3-phosphoshikimate 1-carboxyvinyltransferase
MTAIVITNPESFTRVVTTPGDKSISHRALLLSALAEGTSTIRGLSNGEDVARTATIMSQLGATIKISSDGVLVTGPTEGLRASRETLFCGNSGTTIRLLMGILSGIEGNHHIEGDSSLSRRPMDRVAIPLGLMGVQISGQGDTLTPPLDMKSRKSTKAINYQMPRASAQVKSAILLAGLYGDAETTVSEDVRTRSNTEEMLQYAGISVTSINQGAGRTVSVTPGRPHACHWNIPGDPSQAAFFVVAGLLHPRGNVQVADLYDGEERLGYLTVLSRMGGLIERTQTEIGLSLSVRHSPLRGTTILSTEIPSVDEVPVLVVAACAAQGESRFVEMSELRIKESDRFAESVRLAEALGSKVVVEGDDFTVFGQGSASNFFAIEFDAPDDHRMAMASAVAAFCGQGGVIHGSESVETSFPGFFDLLVGPS